MTGSWLARRSVRRTALAGLAVGLAALAALAIAGAVSTGRATAQVREYTQVSRHWGQVFVRISEEDEALQQYLNTGTDLDRAALAAAIGAAEPELTWLTANGGPEEVFQVTQLRYDYLRFTNTLRAVLNAGRRGDQAAIDAHVRPAAIEFAALRRQAVGNVERNQKNLNVYLAAVDERNRALRTFTIGVFGADLATFALCTAILIGYQRRIERQAVSSHHQAMHDSLTGLANRALFRDRADQALRRASRTSQPFALVANHLNGFKQINDTLGHHAGDLLLKHVADRLGECVRETDTIARLGGDEFSIVLPNVTSIEHATEVAERVLRAIVQPLDLDGAPATVGGSIGVAIYPEHGEHLEELIQHADAAMYTAKRHRLGICVYEPTGRRDPAQLEAAVAAGRRTPDPVLP
jgi:diguanylate cyclase (GGDEF)-like protein